MSTVHMPTYTPNIGCQLSPQPNLGTNSHNSLIIPNLYNYTKFGFTTPAGFTRPVNDPGRFCKIWLRGKKYCAHLEIPLVIVHADMEGYIQLARGLHNPHI